MVPRSFPGPCSHLRFPPPVLFIPILLPFLLSSLSHNIYLHAEPAGFKETVERYNQELTKLGRAIMRAMALGLGLGEHYFEDKQMKDPFWYIRIIGITFSNTFKLLTL